MLAGIGALAWATLATGAAAPAQTSAFVAPEHPVLVSRTVVRSLADGKEVRATRRYLVRFHREPGGWRIEGELRGVEVKAPPALEPFAAIERSRSDDGFFPIRLDPAGQLKPRDGLPTDTARQAALALGQSLIARSPTVPANRDQARALLDQVAQAWNGGTAWPADLFRPIRPESLEQREILLPDGSKGSILVTLRSEGTLAGHLPERVERTVETELAGTRRSTREVWTFAPAGH